MTHTRNLISFAFLVTLLMAASLFSHDILNPVSVKHEWRSETQLLRPFPITNPPLLRIRKDYPPDRYESYDFSKLRGEWVLAIIAPFKHSAQNQDIGGFRSDLRVYARAVKHHFEHAKLKPVHLSFLRLDDLIGYEYYDTIRMFPELMGVNLADSIGITSPYFDGLGNTYSSLFMQWIQRTDEMARKGRDKFQVYNRLDRIGETYPVVMLIDPQGFVQLYWRDLGPGSYTTYQTIRSVQKAHDEARRMQAIYDGSAVHTPEGVTSHD